MYRHYLTVCGVYNVGDELARRLEELIDRVRSEADDGLDKCLNCFGYSIYDVEYEGVSLSRVDLSACCYHRCTTTGSRYGRVRCATDVERCRFK